MTEPSAPSLTDKRLWAGAEKQGWTIVNRGNVEGTGKYWYVSPTGHRCESKAAAQQAQAEDTDRKLWAGAAAAGWQVLPRGSLESAMRHKKFWLIHPDGRKCKTRQEAHDLSAEQGGGSSGAPPPPRAKSSSSSTTAAATATTKSGGATAAGGGQKRRREPSAASASAGGDAVAYAWLRIGAEAEVCVREGGVASRYRADVTAVDVDDGRFRALMRYSTADADGGAAGTAPAEWVDASWLTPPPPPPPPDFFERLAPGDRLQLWHDGGWCDASLVDKSGGGSFDVRRAVGAPPPRDVSAAARGAAREESADAERDVCRATADELRPGWRWRGGRHWDAPAPAGLAVRELSAAEGEEALRRYRESQQQQEQQQEQQHEHLASSSSSSSSSAAGGAVAEPETAADEAPAAANGHHANGRAKGGGGRRAAEAARLAAAEAELERSVRHGRALRAAAVSYRGHADELSAAVATLEPLAVSVDASAARPPRDPLPPLPPEEPPPDGDS